MIPLGAALLLALIVFLPALATFLVILGLVPRIARRRGLMPPDKRTWAESRWVFRPAAGLLVVYALCFAWGSLVEADWVQTTRTEIMTGRPVMGHEAFRIVHLSDLHLERFGRREARVIERVREASPHLILLTGDYMNVREGGAALHELLSHLKPLAPMGVFGVPGNWDVKFTTRRIFENAGAVLLSDETRLLERAGAKLRLVGHDVYPNRPLRELLRGLDDGAYTIYLHHKPDAVDELQNRDPDQRVDLFLCGHTHGGQVCLPFWGAVITLSKYHKTYERGRYDFQGVPMYVNRGVGMEGGAAPRARFLSRPEVAVIDLVSKPQNR